MKKPKCHQNWRKSLVLEMYENEDNLKQLYN